jgi:plasmid maintenance system killer protein
MKIDFAPSFLYDLLELSPAKLRTKCLKQITTLQKTSADQLFSNKLPPGWHLEKLASSNLWSLRIDLSYRMSFTVEGNALTLYRVGTHDYVYSPQAVQNDRWPSVCFSVNEPDVAQGSAPLQGLKEPWQAHLPKELRGHVVEELTLGKIAEDEQLRLLLLDEEQFRCIDEFLVDNTRALVSGGAGTGKTLIACEAARRLGSQGKRVLLVCFTEALAHWLRSQINSDKIGVWAIKRLAIDLLDLAGKKVDVPTRREDWTPEFWRSVVPLALREAGAAIAALDYNAVVVDEGQDLDADDWELIERLFDENRRLWIFHDPSQSLWPDRSLPATGFAKYHLRNQYRCYEEIQALASLYQSAAGQRPVRSGSAIQPENVTGRRIVLIQCSSRNDVSHAVAQEIGRCLAEGFQRSDIAIISLVSRTDRGALAGLDELEGHILVRADDKRLRDEVVADSVYRFKGLERPVVILTDLSLRGREDDATRRAKMNVAITRAQSFLRIIDTSGAISKEPELDALLD